MIALVQASVQPADHAVVAVGGRDRRQSRPSSRDAGRADVHADDVGRCWRSAPGQASSRRGCCWCFTFLIGCGTAINGPGVAGVGRRHGAAPRCCRARWRSIAMGFNIARSAGPAIGGAIVAVAGAAAAFAINAASYVGLIVVLSRWRPDLPPRRLPRERLGVAMVAGVRYVALSPHIRAVLIRAVVFGAGRQRAPCADAAGRARPARRRAAHLRPAAGRVRRRRGGGRAGRRAGCAGACRPRGSCGCRRVALAIGATATALLGDILADVARAGARRRRLGARAVELQRQRADGVAALGRRARDRALPDGGVRRHGDRAAGCSARSPTIMACNARCWSPRRCSWPTSLAGLILRLPTISELEPRSSEGWREPKTAIPVEPRSGPIVITIEHRIAERRHRRLPDGDGRASPHPPPRRRAALGAAARSRRGDAVDRALPFRDVARISPP